MGARLVSAAPDTPWTRAEYEDTWHNTDFAIILRDNNAPHVLLNDILYRINDGPILSVDLNSPFGENQPWINQEGANNVLEYWGVDVFGAEETPHNRLEGIKLDKTAPTGSIVINDGSGYTSQSDVTLHLTAIDDTSDVSQVRYSNDGIWDTEQWGTYAATKAWALIPGDGYKTVYYQVRDNAGWVSAYQASVTFDTSPPAGSIVIGSSNETYAGSTIVTLYLTYADAISGVGSVRYRNSPMVWAGWESPSSTKSWTLISGEGPKTVQYQVMDNAGNPSEIYSDSIILDATPPSGSIVISGGIEYTRSPAVMLSLSASDSGSGVSQVQYSNTGEWGASPWEDYSPFRFWNLSSGDGKKTVYYQVMDGAGHTSVYTDTITLDTKLPTGSIVINLGNPQYTNSPGVTIYLDYSATEGSGIADVRYRNEGLNYSDNWEPASATRQWNLLPGDGMKRVYCQLKDKAGNIAEEFYDTIIMDTKAPTAVITINGGAKYTAYSSANLTMTAGDEGSGVDQVRYSSDGTWSPLWENYAVTRTWTLSPSDGAKTIYYQVRDRAGNINQTSTQIFLDTTPPTGSIAINGGAGYTNKTSVTLTLGASDTSGVTKMRFSNRNDTAAFTTWYNYSQSKTWLLMNSDTGVKTVYVQFEDGAGYTSPIYSDTIVMDKVKPTVISGGDRTVDQNQTVTFDASSSTDDNEIERYAWVFMDGSQQETLPGKTQQYSFKSSGKYEVALIVTDKAGNTAVQSFIVTVRGLGNTDPFNAGLLHWTVPLALAAASIMLGTVIILRRRRY